jgi:hypothetical protein
MTIKIPVEADVTDVTKKIQGLEKTVQQANRVQWKPVDSSAIDKETAKVEAAFKRLYGGRSIAEVRAGYTPAQPDPNVGPRGGARRPPRRDRFGRADFGVSDLGQQFSSGLGGGIQTIGSYGMRGARADAEGGGSGAMGLIKGLGWGAAAFGALKAGQAVSEGVDMSKDRALNLDTLKRQMGDVGVSFEKLKAYSDKLSDGLGVNSVEFVKLETNLQRLERVTESPESLAQNTAFGIGVSRSYGLESGTAGNFFGGMKNVDSRQNNRELALILADTIARSGMNARADEVMQAILNFSSTASKLSLASGNVAGFGNAYAGLMETHLPGMTPENASSILMQANQGVTSMGAGAGEAGRNFMLSAFNRNGGGINPIQGEALAQGGLFGTRASVFGQGAIRQFIGDKGMGNLAGGPNANTSNFDAIRSQISAMGGNKWFQLEGAQRLFGVQSLSQAAALLNLPQGQGNSLAGLMQSNGLDINKFSASGISRLGAISAAGTDRGKLGNIFVDMKSSGVLSGEETKSLTSAQQGTPEQFRNALIKVASMKDQANDQGEQLRSQTASLENIKINTGDKLLNPIIAMSDAIVAASGRTPQSAREAVINQSYDDSEAQINEAAHRRTIAAASLPYSQQLDELDKIRKEQYQAVQIDEAHRAADLHNAHSPYEITVNANVNVKTPDGGVQKTTTRTNVGAPQPSGSRTVNVGTH